MKRTQVLNLGKHFSIIDSPVPFYLIDNYGFRAYRPSGAWQFDNWKLLPEKFHKNYPVYTLFIEWDSGINDDIFPTFTDTDLDLGDGIAGVSGQPVNITTPVTVSNLPNVNVGEQVCVPVHIETNLQPLEVVNHANNIVDGFICIGSVYGEKDLSTGMVIGDLRKFYFKEGSIFVQREGSTVHSLAVSDCYICLTKNTFGLSALLLFSSAYDYNTDTRHNGRIHVDNFTLIRGAGLYKELD